MGFWKKLFGNKESKQDQPATISPNVNTDALRQVQSNLAGKNFYVFKDPDGKRYVVMKKLWVERTLRENTPDRLSSEREKKATIVLIAGTCAELPREQSIAHANGVRNGHELVTEWPSGVQVFNSPVPPDWEVPCYVVPLLEGFKGPSTISPSVNQEGLLALFIFNSDNISSNVSPAYGNYAQKEILKALSEVIKSIGGWTTYSSLILGCEGDLSETSMMGETPSLRVLSDWLIKGAYGIDGSCVDSQLLTNIKKHQNINYIPYVVGIGPIEKSNALDVHQKLKAKNPVGYLGLFTLSGTIDIPDLDSLLYLPQHMKIKGNKCTGWLVSSDDLHDAGLVESA